MKFIVVSDIHLTQHDGFPKQNNISERSLLLLKNFVNIVKHNESDELILLVVGDWFDNINKLHSIDLQITNMIFKLFKKVIFINGNHDLYSSHSSNNFQISSGDILSSNKQVTYFNDIKLINVGSDYFWLLPYKTDTQEVLPKIEFQLKSLLQSKTYNNSSKHYFFSHLSIDEIEKTFFNHEKEYFKYTDFVKLMTNYKIDFEFFQGHYHLKSSENIIQDKRFHIISTFPKNFSDVVKSLNNFSNFGYYEIDTVTKDFYFKEFEEVFIFYEMEYSENNISDIINFLKSHSNYYVFLKLVVNELNEDKLFQIENLKSYVKRIQIVNKYTKSGGILENQNEEILETTNMIMNIYQYLIDYIKTVSNLSDEYKNKIISSIIQIEREMEQLERGEI